MVTARPATRALRPRSRRAGLRRLLLLAALLIGLLYSHGISAETVEGHVSPLSAVPAADAPLDPVSQALLQHALDAGVADEDLCGGQDHDEREAAHAAHSCLAGKSEHGADLPLPCVCSLSAASTVQASAAPAGAAAMTGAVSISPPPTGGSTVLRI
ncbi:hypothetical protein [Streptomyces violascens]|uniref:Secreted protein n=1 Tax=Streptomyces violascens TaxID=67381 RepID=A0ABQ3QTF0_9ACTN|nr:hypothetical protein [Streptomyces violascens]GHI40530.1 hypothetical protein Sviol_49380 [Streptomyces violascens]